MLLRTVTVIRQSESVNLIQLSWSTTHPLSFQDPPKFTPASKSASTSRELFTLHRVPCMEEPKADNVTCCRNQGVSLKLAYKTLQSLASDNVPVSSLTTLHNLPSTNTGWLLFLWEPLFLLEKSHPSFKIQLSYLITSIPGTLEGLVCTPITTTSIGFIIICLDVCYPMRARALSSFSHTSYPIHMQILSAWPLKCINIS